MSNQHLPDLAADRQADLEKRIGFLEADAASIPGMADYYAGVARDFRTEQAALTGNELEAHGQDYAGSLGRIVANHRAERGDADTAALLNKDAEARFQIAADLRSQSNDRAPNDAEYRAWQRDNLTGDHAQHVAAQETAAEQQHDPAFVSGITDDEIEAAPGPQGKNWLETAAENVRAMNAEATAPERVEPQGMTLAETRAILTGTAKDNAGYVAMNRQAPDDDIDPDPDKPRGRPSPDMPSGPSEGRNYDALKSSHADTQAMLDEEERRKGNAPPVAEIGGPTRPTHIRATMAAEPAPDGTKSSRSTYYDPNDNPAMSDYKAALAEPRPMHPDEHAARFSEDLSAVANSRIVQGDAPAERTLIASAPQTPAERYKAAIADLDTEPTGRHNDAHLVAIEQAASASRQDSERRVDAGEAFTSDAKPMSAIERYEAAIKALDDDKGILAKFAETGREASQSASRGMSL